jgi:hypothetical protein
VADTRAGSLERTEHGQVPREYLAAARTLDGRVKTHYAHRGEERPEAQPSAEEILDSFPPVVGLVFGSTACGGSRSVGTLIEQIADSAAQREWR